jgi:hypothetical protein
MLSGVDSWSEVLLQLLAKLLPVLIKEIKDIAFCQKNWIRCKTIHVNIVFCTSVGPLTSMATLQPELCRWFIYAITNIHRLATSWTVQGSNPGEGEIFRTHPDQPWGPPSLLYNGYRVFPRGNAAKVWCWQHTPFQCRGHERVELYLYPPSRPVRPVTGLLYILLPTFTPWVTYWWPSWLWSFITFLSPAMYKLRHYCWSDYGKFHHISPILYSLITLPFGTIRSEIFTP